MEYTLDYLPNTDIYLYQRKDMFRFNTDTHLLGNFLYIKAGESVLDIGTNNGALLLYASKKTSGKLIGIDIQEEACAVAQKNMEYHQLKNYEILCNDIKLVTLPQVDVIVCNPPYFNDLSIEQMNKNEYLKIARHEQYLSLQDLIQQVDYLLKDKGRFYLIHRASRIVDIIRELNQHQLEIKTMQFIYDENNDEAHGVLIETVKNGGVHCKVIAPHIVKR